MAGWTFSMMKSLQLVDIVIFAKITIDMLKKCFFCGSSDVVCNGLSGRKQLYKCKSCGRQFIGGTRRDKSQVITDYVEGICWLRSNGFRIYTAVIDGMRGLADALWPYRSCCTSSTRCLQSATISRKILTSRRQRLFWTLSTTMQEWTRRVSPAHSMNGTTSIMTSWMNVYMISASKRKLRHICAPGCEAHTSASGGTCRCCGRSTTDPRQGFRTRTMLWKGFSPTSRRWQGSTGESGKRTGRNFWTNT